MILALNTATPWLGMAVMREGQLLAERLQFVDNAHSEAVFVFLEEMCSSLDITPRHFQAMAVATGPGGFTGVRTGLSVAKTVAQLLEIPVVGVPTLEALVVQSGARGWVSPLLDARRGLVFAGLYHFDEEGLKEVLTPGLYPFADWHAQVRARVGGDDVTWLGEGAQCHRAALVALGGRDWIPCDALLSARAVGVALLGAERWRAGEVSDPLTLAPVYLREPQAVVNWEQRQAMV